MSLFEGQIDKEGHAVSFQGEGLALEELDEALAWLRRVRSWLREEQVRHRGGRRWEFSPDGDTYQARYLVGSTSCATVPLVRGRTRKQWLCAACLSTIPGSVLCWRQRAKSHAGHSRERFCMSCVERGSPPPPPPVLQVIDGGKT